MSRNIKNAETYALVKELAEATGETMTCTVAEAVCEHLARIRDTRSAAAAKAPPACSSRRRERAGNDRYLEPVEQRLEERLGLQIVVEGGGQWRGCAGPPEPPVDYPVAMPQTLKSAQAHQSRAARSIAAAIPAASAQRRRVVVRVVHSSAHGPRPVASRAGVTQLAECLLPKRSVTAAG